MMMNRNTEAKYGPTTADWYWLLAWIYALASGGLWWLWIGGYTQDVFILILAVGSTVVAPLGGFAARRQRRNERAEGEGDVQS